MNKSLIVILCILLVVAIGIGVAIFTNNNKNTELKENVLYGEVLKVTENKIDIDAEGTLYAIDISESAVKPIGVKLVQDDFIKIKYQGELKQDIKASYVEVIKDVSNEQSDESQNTVNNTITNVANTVENKTNTTTNATNSDKDKEFYITGTITEITAKQIKMKANINGNIYTFNTENAKKDAEAKNLVKGDIIRIIHKGKVTTDTSKVIDAIYIKKILENKTITCVIEDATMNALKVKYNNKSYEFTTAAAEMNVGNNGILNGDTIKITYKNELSESKLNIAVKVEK